MTPSEAPWDTGEKHRKTLILHSINLRAEQKGQDKHELTAEYVQNPKAAEAFSGAFKVPDLHLDLLGSESVAGEAWH